ncbi:site-specific integrase, partial [Burkholderia thailandensis]
MARAARIPAPGPASGGAGREAAPSADRPADELAASPAWLDSRTSIDLFCDAMWLEHGLSRNTLDAYRRDLQLFAQWLAARHAVSLDRTERPMLEGYIAARSDGKAT